MKKKTSLLGKMRCSFCLTLQRVDKIFEAPKCIVFWNSLNNFLGTSDFILLVLKKKEYVPSKVNLKNRKQKKILIDKKTNIRQIGTIIFLCRGELLDRGIVFQLLIFNLGSFWLACYTLFG